MNVVGNEGMRHFESSLLELAVGFHERKQVPKIMLAIELKQRRNEYDQKAGYKLSCQYDFVNVRDTAYSFNMLSLLTKGSAAYLLSFRTQFKRVYKFKVDKGFALAIDDANALRNKHFDLMY